MLTLIWLDAQGEVLRRDLQVAPHRVVFCRGAQSVLEISGKATSAQCAAIDVALEVSRVVNFCK